MYGHAPFLNPKSQPNKRFYKKYYNEWNTFASDYEISSQHHGHRHDVFNRTIKALNKYKPGKGSLLDVGASDGTFLKIAYKYGWKVHGLELNKTRYKKAKEYFSSYPGSIIKCATIEDSGFKKSSFDAIVLINVIEHVRNPIETCDEAFKLLKPNGCLVIRWPNFKYRKSLHAAPEHLHSYTGKSIRLLMSNAGFSNFKEYWAGVGDFSNDANLVKKIAISFIKIIGKIYVKVTFGRHQILFLSRLIIGQKN